jgi:hypothetical protein
MFPLQILFKCIATISVTIHGVWIGGFTDHLYTRLGTTSNYSATANLLNLQIITAHAKPILACCLHQPFPGKGY